MSGGSYDYFFLKLRDYAQEIQDKARDLHVASSLPYRNKMKRFKLAKLIHLISDAAHDIEWVDSGDFGYGDEIESIDRVFESAKRMTQ